MTFHPNSSQLGEARVTGWSFLADESNNPCLFSSAYCMKLNTILSNVCMAAAGADMHRASSDFEISKPNIVSC